MQANIYKKKLCSQLGSGSREIIGIQRIWIRNTSQLQT